MTPPDMQTRRDLFIEGLRDLSSPTLRDIMNEAQLILAARASSSPSETPSPATACPICMGRGVVSYPPNTPAGAPVFYSGSTGPFTCEHCKGLRVVAVAPVVSDTPTPSAECIEAAVVAGVTEWEANGGGLVSTITRHVLRATVQESLTVGVDTESLPLAERLKACAHHWTTFSHPRLGMKATGSGMVAMTADEAMYLAELMLGPSHVPGHYAAPVVSEEAPATPPKWTHPVGPFPGIIDYAREAIASDVIRKAVDVIGRDDHRFYLTCSVGELAQRVVVALAVTPSPPTAESTEDTARLDWPDKQEGALHDQGYGDYGAYFGRKPWGTAREVIDEQIAIDRARTPAEEGKPE